jgi:hypothetical protein
MMLGFDGAGPEEPTAQDNGWDDDDTVEDADPGDPATVPEGGETPIGAPTAADAAAAAAASSLPAPTGIVKKPAPEPDPRKGLGLLIASGAVGAVAWGGAAARIGLVKKCIDGDQNVSTVLDCVRAIPSYLGLTVLVWLANDATYGLAPGAGVVRGRYEASEFAYSGKYDRKGTIWTAVGGATLGAGIIGKVALWAMSFNVFKCPTDTVEDVDNLDSCIRRKWTGMLLAHQFVSSTIAGGAGALGFGIYYTKERAARTKLFFRPEQVRITPFGNFDSLGLSLTGRF